VGLIVATWDKEGRMKEVVLKTSSLKQLLERDGRELGQMNQEVHHVDESMRTGKGRNDFRTSLLEGQE
jgi:hypothetical protein